VPLKLVKNVSTQPEQANQEKSRDEYLVACLRDEVNDPKYSDWERSFIASVARQMHQGRKLSDKQKAILERIWGK
jgi:hypothetical protein